MKTLRVFTDYRVAVAAVAMIVLSGCSLKTMAIKSMANTLSRSGDTFSRDNDPELVRDAIPFALKTYESLLDSIPKHQGLLLATCSGFTQYAYAFIQTDADLIEAQDYDAASRLNDRALNLYMRGRDYCVRALELRHHGVERELQIDPGGALKWATPGDVALLYWTGASWGAAIAVGLDRPGLVSDVPAVKALMQRALDLQDDNNHGAVHAAMISLEALPAAMGGSPSRARQHFALAVEMSGGFDPGPYVTLATSLAQPAQDREEFVALLTQALAIDPERRPSTRLPTLITQKRARHLLSRVDDLFAGEATEEDVR